MGSDTQFLPKRRLGRTEIEISPIGLGTWQFSEASTFHRLIWSRIDPGTTDEIVAAALVGGITWFDTAEAYGGGRSERGLARALSAAGKHPGEVVIATKWQPVLRRAGSIGRTIDRRLANLSPFGIDLHQIHTPASFSPVEAEMDAMADLVEAGKIHAVGVSNFSAEQMRRAHAALARRGLPLASNQVKYSLLDRTIERNGVLDTAKDLDVTIIAYSPLEMGLLTGKFHRDPDLVKRLPLGRRFSLRRKLKRSSGLIAALEEVAKRRGVAMAQVALNWLVTAHGDTIVAIPGASRPQHARESADAMTFTLTSEEQSLLDRLTR
jgi:aryl-alcohol dehydrogenase-like predicted oxidoreductase